MKNRVRKIVWVLLFSNVLAQTQGIVFARKDEDSGDARTLSLARDDVLRSNMLNFIDKEIDKKQRDIKKESKSVISDPKAAINHEKREIINGLIKMCKDRMTEFGDERVCFFSNYIDFLMIRRARIDGDENSLDMDQFRKTLLHELIESGKKERPLETNKELNTLNNSENLKFLNTKKSSSIITEDKKSVSEKFLSQGKQKCDENKRILNNSPNLVLCGTEDAEIQNSTDKDGFGNGKEDSDINRAPIFDVINNNFMNLMKYAGSNYKFTPNIRFENAAPINSSSASIGRVEENDADFQTLIRISLNEQNPPITREKPREKQLEKISDILKDPSLKDADNLRMIFKLQLDEGEYDGLSDDELSKKVEELIKNYVSF